jgi:alpha-glucosidase
MKPEFARTGRIRDHVGRNAKTMGIRHTRQVTSTLDQDHLASTEAATDLWRTAVVYQIYPRSFADSNGDGIGDLPGITSRVPYLRSLALDAVWLSPFYPSALADGGYDIDDHREVDPRLGSLADFDAMVQCATCCAYQGDRRHRA